MANQESIGALWIKNGSKGAFLSGKIKVGEVEIQLVCFANSFKKESKHPDWRVFISEPQKEINNTGWKENNEKAVVDFETKKEPVIEQGLPAEESINPEDIPF